MQYIKTAKMMKTKFLQNKQEFTVDLKTNCLESGDTNYDDVQIISCELFVCVQTKLLSTGQIQINLNIEGGTLDWGDDGIVHTTELYNTFIQLKVETGQEIDLNDYVFQFDIEGNKLVY